MLEAACPLLLVGAGKMGGAMLDGWLAKGVDPARLTVLDPHLDPLRAADLLQRGARVAGVAGEVAPRSFRTIVLAVKPQMMPAALASAPPFVDGRTIVVSIAAGIRLATLQETFPDGQPIVRAMPNTPAQIGMAMTVAVANTYVVAEQRGSIDELLTAIGKVAWINDEPLMDAVTAVSGSGPAYVFLLAECLAEAGRRAGLPADLALTLARQTVAGAGLLMASSPEPPATLRRNVTSPNGTTAAALDVLMANDGLPPLMTRAVEAAKRRSVELG